MPAGIWLVKFGEIVRDYFGHVAYHVGSSVMSKGWRDIDVRVLLPDEEFEAQFGSGPNALFALSNPKLAAVTLAFSVLGQQMTGLPIDFQIQPVTWANEKFSQRDGCVRSALLELRPTEEGS